ncbi:Bax inhibitor-1/YccA family protein [Streptomyces sp. Ru62]|uniref:Bax inhibitor-1/YccA family membrane protein n=1 Tax=Streptomyces sp. Ru62 TaxID=2080745 RepID=UPI0027E4FDE0|nr:Bax inhibitor-1/YccA family protein [Streptomyces sp. Ru62]
MASPVRPPGGRPGAVVHAHPPVRGRPLRHVRRAPSPAPTLGYAAFEGVFLGFLSAAVSAYVAPGVVVQAVPGHHRRLHGRADRVPDVPDGRQAQRRRPPARRRDRIPPAHRRRRALSGGLGVVFGVAASCSAPAS